jgi:hypothetical protein
MTIKLIPNTATRMLQQDLAADLEQLRKDGFGMFRIQKPNPNIIRLH